MNKKAGIIAALSGIAAVILGAFGAHGLKAYIDVAGLEVWKTAVSYHFYHTLALLMLAVWPIRISGFSLLAMWFFLAGVVLFSGSLYLLTLHGLLGAAWLMKLGPVTPIGGLFFIAGWFMLFLAFLKKN